MRCWWPSTRCTTSSLRIDRNTTRLRNGSGSCRDRWVLWRGLECKQLWWGLFWFVFWAAFGGLVGSFGVLFTCLWFCLHFGVFLWSLLGFYLLVCGVVCFMVLSVRLWIQQLLKLYLLICGFIYCFIAVGVVLSTFLVCQLICGFINTFASYFWLWILGNLFW